MQNLFTIICDWLLRMFWATEMNVSVVGLQNAGKTSLVRVLAGSDYAAHPNPTVGFNVKRIQKGHVTIKCWDLGGQARFRPMWERYCRDVNVIVFVTDAADPSSLPTAAQELHALLSSPLLRKTPLLVLGNKSDLPTRLGVDELIDELGLKAVRDRDVGCYAVSAKYETNLDAVVQWLVARSAPR